MGRPDGLVRCRRQCCVTVVDIAVGLSFKSRQRESAMFKTVGFKSEVRMCFSDGSRSYSEDLTTPTTPSDSDASDSDRAMFNDRNVKPSAFKNKQFFCGEMKPGGRSSALCLEAAAQVSLGRKVAQVERERQPLVSHNGFHGTPDADRNHKPCFPWQQKSKWKKSSGMRPPVPAKPTGSGGSNIPSPPPPMPQILSPPVQVGVGQDGFRPEGVTRWGKPADSDPLSPTRVDSLKHKVEVGVRQDVFRPEGVTRWGKPADSDPLSPKRVNSLNHKVEVGVSGDEFRPGRVTRWGKPAVSDPPSPTLVNSLNHKVEVGVGQDVFRPEGVTRWAKAAVTDPPSPTWVNSLNHKVEVGVSGDGFRQGGVTKWGKPAVSDPPSPTRVNSLNHKVEVGVSGDGFRPEGVKRWGKPAASDPPSPTRVNSLKAKLGMREGRDNVQPVASPGMTDRHNDEPVVNSSNMKTDVHNKSALKVRLPLRKIDATDQQCRINVNLQVSQPPQNASVAPRDLKRSVKKLNIYHPQDANPSVMRPATLPKPPTPSDSSSSNPRKLFKSSTPDLMLESPMQSLPQRWLQNLPKWNAQNREAQHCVVAERRRSPSIEKPPHSAPAPVNYNFKVKKVKPKVSLGFVRIGQMWVAQVGYSTTDVLPFPCIVLLHPVCATSFLFQACSIIFLSFPPPPQSHTY